MSSSQGEPQLPPGVSARFATTQWSVVLKASQGAEEALLKLCQVYWIPLYAFTVRRGHGVHEAQDLTQAFFEHVLGKRAFETVAPDKGRFRSFLLVALKNFLDNEWKKQKRLKRGGGRLLISWDQLNSQERELFESSDSLSPEKLYDRQWALTILERAKKQLEREYTAGGKEVLFRELKAYLIGDAGERAYGDVAKDLGMSVGYLKVSVHRLRRRYGELVRDQISRTMANPEEIDDELRELLAALS